MTKMDNPTVIAKYIHCLSVLEHKTSLLYRHLSDRVEPPLVKSLLLSVSKDSSKHSTLLKGVADSVFELKQNTKECEKNLGEVWKMVSTQLNEIDKRERKNELSFSEMLPTLTALESSLGEEYYIFVQMKTLQFMVKEINQLYGINLETIRKVFESIIRDEEHHREIFAMIKDIFDENSTKQDNTPKVKYQNPDGWIHSLPPATYDSR